MLHSDDRALTLLPPNPPDDWFDRDPMLVRAAAAKGFANDAAPPDRWLCGIAVQFVDCQMVS